MFGASPFGKVAFSARSGSGLGQPSISRAIVEVIHGLDFTPATGNLSFTRDLVETIGSASAIAGKSANVGRIALEVIAASAGFKKGFTLPSVAVTQASIFLVLDPESWSSGGQFHLHSAADTGLTVFGDATTTTIRYTDGTRSVSTTLATPTAKKLVSILTGATAGVGQVRVDRLSSTPSTSGTTWGALTLTDLNSLHPVAYPKSGQIAELMVYNRTLDDAERDYVEAYLWCKWFTPGCNIHGDLPASPLDPNTIRQGLLDSVGGPSYQDLIGDMRASPGVEDWLGCFGVDMPPSPADPNKPFRRSGWWAERRYPSPSLSPKVYWGFGDTKTAACNAAIPVWLAQLRVDLEAVGNHEAARWTESSRVSNESTCEVYTAYTYYDFGRELGDQYMTMAEMLALWTTCPMGDDAAADIRDSGGYLGA